MRRAAFALVALSLASVALAVPATLTHSGRLADASGVPLEGAQSVTFSFYDSATGGSMLWTETHDLTLDDGYYAVVLGAQTPLDDATLDASALWVGLTVGGADLPDRLPLTSVPYALRANTATNVEGGTVNATSIQVNGVSVVSEDGSVAWDRISGAPEDEDSFADLLCGAGESPIYDGAAWGCGLPAPSSLDAGVIDTGTLSIARLPIGSSSSEVAAGDHTHDAAHVTTGVFDGGRIPDLDAAKVTSGSFLDARIPALDAGKIASGVFDVARIPSLDATRITTGTFDVARIPDLDAGKIVSGTVALARLPTGTAPGTVALGNHTHTAAQVGALPANGGTVSGNLNVTGSLTAGSTTGLNTFKFITPVNWRTTCNANALRANQAPPSGVPSNAKAMLASVFTYSTTDDHVNYGFGATTTASTWDNAVYNTTNPMASVIITHNGQSAGRDFYGMGHGTQIIPMKSNGTFDLLVCNGYSSGTHYLTLTVYGFVE